MSITPLELDPRPIDWTSYAGRPLRDPGYGFGVIDGYQRYAGSQYPVKEFPADLSFAVLEHEDGPVSGGVVNKTDPRSFPKEAPAFLSLLRATAKEMRRQLLVKYAQRPKPVPLFWYRPIMLRPGHSLREYRDGVKAQADSGMFDAVDGLVLDAHPHEAEAQQVWESLIEDQIATLAPYKKPIVLVIGEQWHANDGAKANLFLTADEIVPRYRFARRHKGVAGVARMGGCVADKDGGNWRRLPYGCNPAEAAINEALGVAV